jgi:hypothetical protein
MDIRYVQLKISLYVITFVYVTKVSYKCDNGGKVQQAKVSNFTIYFTNFLQVNVISLFLLILTYHRLEAQLLLEVHLLSL